MENHLTIEKEASVTIREGAEYIYVGRWPAGRLAGRYRVLRFVTIVPAYQQQVLMEALEGPDKGLWFVITPANFALRYVSAYVEPEREPDPQPEFRAVGLVSESWRTGA